MFENLTNLPLSFGYFYLFITGLIFGSFLNVVVLRAFSEESIILPPSKCPSCKNKLKWYHNIPLFSYIFLRGRCGFCKEKISIQYPIVELLTGLGFLGMFAIFGYSLLTIFGCIFVFFSLVIALTDIKESVIFTQHTIAFTICGLIYSFFNVGGGEGWTNFVNAVIGVIIPFAVIYSLIFIGKKLLKKEIFGGGDADIIAAICAFLGYKYCLDVLMYGACIYGCIFIIPFFINILKQKEYLLFGLLFAFLGLSILGFCWQELLYQYNTLFVSIMTILGILCAVLLFKEIKDGKFCTQLPLGPALVVAGLVLFILKNTIDIPSLYDYINPVLEFYIP